MPSLDFTLTINANAVAWYAAVVSTIGCLLSLFVALRHRAHLVVELHRDMRIYNLPPYDPTKLYLDVTLRNRGRRPVKISTIIVILYDRKGSGYLNDSLLQLRNRVLTEEDPRTNFFVDQSLLNPNSVYCVIVTTENGRTYRQYMNPVIGHLKYWWYVITGKRKAASSK
jgi:hypothetical protein